MNIDPNLLKKAIENNSVESEAHELELLLSKLRDLFAYDREQFKAQMKGPRRSNLANLRKAVKTAQQHIKFCDSFIERNEILTVAGREGAGKTNIMNALCAAFLAKRFNTEAHEQDLMHFRFDNVQEDHVYLHIDTEQSEAKEHKFLLQACMRAKLSVDELIASDCVHYVRLAETANTDRIQLLIDALVDAVSLHKRVHTVALDLVSDFVLDTNSLEQSTLLVRALTTLQTMFDCAIVCSIHTNPTTLTDAKLRGHLGSELMRRSALVCMLTRDNEQMVLTSDSRTNVFAKSRNGAAGTVVLEWRQAAKEDSSVIKYAFQDSAAKAYVLSRYVAMLRRDSVKRTTFVLKKSTLQLIFELAQAFELDEQELKQAILDYANRLNFPLSERAAKAKIDRAVKSKYIVKLEGNRYTLND